MTQVFSSLKDIRKRWKKEEEDKEKKQKALNRTWMSRPLYVLVPYERNENFSYFFKEQKKEIKKESICALSNVWQVTTLNSKFNKYLLGNYSVAGIMLNIVGILKNQSNLTHCP